MNKMFEMPPSAGEKNQKRPDRLENRESFEWIDFHELREIFAEHVRRSGLDSEQMNFVEEKDIIKDPPAFKSPLAGGWYSAKDKKITIHTLMAEVLATRDKKDAKDLVLEMICHEEAHAVSYSHYEEEQDDALLSLMKKGSIKVQIGFDQQNIETKGSLIMKSDTKLRWFNEGVTDELASVVYQEYVRRSGSGEEKKYDSKYPLARIFVRTFCERLGEECGIPKEVVWQSVVREYLSGTDLLNGEVADLLNEVFSDKFVARLARADTKFLELGPIVMAFHEILDTASAKKVFLEIASKIKKLAQ